MEIERESFRAIEAECDLHKWSCPHRNGVWRAACIHTTADPSHRGHAGVPARRRRLRAAGVAGRCADILRFQDDPRRACPSRGCSRLNPGYGPGTAALPYRATRTFMASGQGAKAAPVPCAARRRLRPLLDGAIVLIGNAPLALARIARYALEEGARPCPRRRDARGVRQRGGVQGPPCPAAPSPRSPLRDGAAAAPSRSPRCTPSWRARRDSGIGGRAPSMREAFVPAGNKISRTQVNNLNILNKQSSHCVVAG